jgi:hypothetical protein
VDLCSGGTGPLLLLVKESRGRRRADSGDADRSLSDAPAFAEIAAASGGLIDFEPCPSTRATCRLTSGLRTIFNGFHHLPPSDARSVLHAAAPRAQPIAHLRVSERSLRTLPVVLTPLFVWLATPFMRPSVAAALLDLSSCRWCR